MADDSTAKSPPGATTPPTSSSPTPAKTPPAKSPTGSKPSSPAAQNAGSSPSVAPAGILPAEHWTQNPPTTADDENDDAESALGAEALSTASVSSSILNYRTIHGRRYHSEVGNAQYWGTNDDQGNESMDINHHNLTLGIGGKLFLAPLDTDRISHVLDVGTGTGLWAIDFADAYPEVEVVGTDISPIQPTWIPPNIKFEIEDYTRPWTFDENSFDFVHLRWLLGSVPDWDALLHEAYRATKPGGWVQSYEASVNYKSDHAAITPDSALGQWGKFYEEGGKKMGNSCRIVEEELQRKGMEAAGFINIEEYNFKVS